MLLLINNTQSCPAAFAPDDVPTVCSAWIMNDSHQPTHLLLSPPPSSLLSGYIIKLLRRDRNNRSDAGPDSSAPLPPDRTAGNICSAQNKRPVGRAEPEHFCGSGLWSCCSARGKCVCKRCVIKKFVSCGGGRRVTRLVFRAAQTQRP